METIKVGVTYYFGVYHARGGPTGQSCNFVIKCWSIVSSESNLTSIISHHTKLSRCPHSCAPHSPPVVAVNVTTMHLWAHALLYWHQLHLPRELSLRYGFWFSHATPHDGSMPSHLLLHIHIRLGLHTCAHTQLDLQPWVQMHKVSLAQSNIYYVFNN